MLFTRAPLSKEEALAIADAAERIDVTAARAAARKLSGRDISRWAQRSSVNDEVVGMLIASLDREIAVASPQGRAALLRDKVMFIAARCVQLTVERLLSLRVCDIQDGGDQTFSFWSGVTTPGQASAMLRWYADTVLWRLGPKVGSGLFTTQTGQSMHKSLVGARFARAVHAAALDRAVRGWAAWARARHS